MIETLQKYSASGNDFLISSIHSEPQYPLHKLAKLLCNRFEGIGADGLVILKPHTQYAYEWEFYNSDGSKAKMCGNASRCVGLYAFLHSLAPKKHTFLSGAGEIGIEILSSNYPYKVLSHLGAYRLLKEYNEEGQKWLLLDTGVPHLTTVLPDKESFESFSVKKMKTLRFLHNANVNIAYADRDHYWIKTYERGVEGITLACGTGMASLVAFLKENQKLQANSVSIIPPIKESLEFFIHNKKLSFQGEVKKIATCQISLKDYGVKI